jgi:hypothetical protein
MNHGKSNGMTANGKRKQGRKVRTGEQRHGSQPIEHQRFCGSKPGSAVMQGPFPFRSEDETPG